MYDVSGVSRDQLQRSAPRVRRYIDPELSQGVTGRIDLTSIFGVPTALVAAKAFSKKAGDLSSEFISRGINAADVITPFERH
jgi:hypothetical protein